MRYPAQDVCVLAIVLVLALVALVIFEHCFSRVSTHCIGDYDSYRLCNLYTFNNCTILKKDEWTYLGFDYIMLMPSSHSFEKVGDMSQVRRYSHHDMTCLDTRNND